jgi:hypothetical protein
MLTRRPFEVPLTRESGCAAIARRLVERHFSLELDELALADLKALATQLVETAYRDGAGTIRLRLQKDHDSIRVEAIDDLVHAAARLDTTAPPLHAAF